VSVTRVRVFRRGGVRDMNIRFREAGYGPFVSAVSAVSGSSEVDVC
jgi:hypothetical protein